MGCIIELFVSKHVRTVYYFTSLSFLFFSFFFFVLFYEYQGNLQVPKDQKIIDFVDSLYNIWLEQETMKLNPKCLTKQPVQELMFNVSPSMDYLTDISAHQYLPQHSFDHFFEGFSTDSIPSDDPPAFDSSSKYGSQKFYESEKSVGITDNYLFGEKMDFIPNCSELIGEEEENLKVFKISETEQHKSKNLIAERNRRHRLKDRIHSLRSLVPKITKVG